MLYRGLCAAARTASRISLIQAHSSLRQLPVQFQQVRSYADRVVKVPQMAESITEGTLKQWSKRIGDYVEQDEEIVTIETDKVGQSCPRKLQASRLFRFAANVLHFWVLHSQLIRIPITD